MKPNVGFNKLLAELLELFGIFLFLGGTVRFLMFQHRPLRDPQGDWSVVFVFVGFCVFLCGYKLARSIKVNP